MQRDKAAVAQIRKGGGFSGRGKKASTKRGKNGYSWALKLFPVFNESSLVEPANPEGTSPQTKSIKKKEGDWGGGGE